MKYYLDVSGRPREVELVERSGRLEVRVDGEPLEVTYREVDRLGQVALTLGERTYAVSIDGDARECGVTVAGRFFRVSIEDERERAAHAAERERSAGGGPVKSIMPGVVVEVLVEEGQAVEEGQSLVILEAMKMQNEIPAPAAGVITAIHVARGEAVGSGARLVTIGPAAG